MNPAFRKGVIPDVDRRTPRSRPTVRAGRILLAAVAAAAAFAASACLGGPAMRARAAVPAAFAGLQVWQDEELLIDAPPGGVLDVGFTLWDAPGDAFADINGLYVRLQPKTGTAAPSNGVVVTDFPGHVTATVLVPEGGIGPFDIGLLAGTCWDGHGCADVELPVALAGFGPPDGAPRESYIGAFFDPFVGDLVADRPFPVKVEVYPRENGLWTKIDQPMRLLITATGNGVEVARGDVTFQDIYLPYLGHLAIPEIGDYQLQLYAPAGDGDLGWPVAGGSVWVKVVKGGRATPAQGPAVASTPGQAVTGDVPPDEPATADQAGVPWLPIGIGVGVVLALLGIRLLRREW